MFDADRPAHAYVSSLYADPEDESCRRRYIRLGIYPTADDLRRAAGVRSRAKSERRDDYDFAGTLGVFQPTPFTARYDRKRRQWIDTSSACAGVMRLCREALNAEVIAHESTHAALHVLRLHAWNQPGEEPSADLGDNCGPREEHFAYLLGGITGVVTDIVEVYREQTGA